MPGYAKLSTSKYMLRASCRVVLTVIAAIAPKKYLYYGEKKFAGDFGGILKQAIRVFYNICARNRSRRLSVLL
jgi:hypothetical protein